MLFTSVVVATVIVTAAASIIIHKFNYTISVFSFHSFHIITEIVAMENRIKPVQHDPVATEAKILNLQFGSNRLSMCTLYIRVCHTD